MALLLHRAYIDFIYLSSAIAKCYYPHFTGKGTEALRVLMTYPTSHSEGQHQGLGTGWSDAEHHAFPLCYAVFQISMRGKK